MKSPAREWRGLSWQRSADADYRNGPRATLCAFDLIEIDGEDLRWRPIEDRKAASRS